VTLLGGAAVGGFGVLERSLPREPVSLLEQRLRITATD
jgi:hypothetical protein